MRAGLTPVVAMVVLAMLTVAAVGGAAVFVSDIMAGAEEQAVEPRLDIKSVVTDCDRWLVDVAVQNTGEQNVTVDDLDVYLYGSRYYRLTPDELAPHDVGRLHIPFFGLTDEREFTVSSNFEYTRRFDWPCEQVDNATSEMGLVAWRSGGSGAHWVSYDYVDENYSFYSSDDDALTADDGPETGEVEVVEGTDEYTIQTSPSSWDDRPVDSPIVLVRNPDPSTSWRFNWTDPTGSYVFHLDPVRDAEHDYLVFWEDLYNPYDPPGSVDDWKDHVVRFSYIPPNMYRVAVYLGKGGYKHGFHLFVDESDPFSAENVYNKSHGEWVSHDDDGIYYEDASYFAIGE